MWFARILVSWASDGLVTHLVVRQSENIEKLPRDQVDNRVRLSLIRTDSLLLHPSLVFCVCIGKHFAARCCLDKIVRVEIRGRFCFALLANHKALQLCMPNFVRQTLALFTRA